MDKILHMLVNGKAADFKSAVSTILTDKFAGRKEAIRKEVGQSFSTPKE